MFNRKSKGKSSPIILVTPGDVVSAQHLLRVQQDSLALFFSRFYYSYKFLLIYLTLIALAGASTVWLVLSHPHFPGQPYIGETLFIGLEAAASLLAVFEFIWRLALKRLCEYLKEPLHWLDFALISLWFLGLGLIFWSQDEKYQDLALAAQVLFVLRTLVPGALLFRHLRSAEKYDSTNLNILNISQLPGEKEEVEVIALDESGQNSQNTQNIHSGRIGQGPSDVRVEKNRTYFSPKHVEAGMKLELEEE